MMRFMMLKLRLLDRRPKELHSEKFGAVFMKNSLSDSTCSWNINNSNSYQQTFLLPSLREAALLAGDPISS